MFTLTSKFVLLSLFGEGLWKWPIYSLKDNSNHSHHWNRNKSTRWMHDIVGWVWASACAEHDRHQNVTMHSTTSGHRIWHKAYTHNYGQHRDYESSWTTPAGIAYMDAAHWFSIPCALQDMYTEMAWINESTIAVLLTWRSPHRWVTSTQELSQTTMAPTDKTLLPSAAPTALAIE